MNWWVYLAEGCDGHLYCGISTDPERRVREHNTSKRGAKWARAHRPLKLVWSEWAGTKGAALKRERQIKRLNAAAKRRLAGKPATQKEKGK
jgi:putative endonuclease